MSLKRITALLIALYNALRKQIDEIRQVKQAIDNKTTINAQTYIYDQSSGKWIPLTPPLNVNVNDWKYSDSIYQLISDQYDALYYIYEYTQNINNNIPSIVNNLKNIYNALYDASSGASNISMLESINTYVTGINNTLSDLYNLTNYVFDRTSMIMAQLKDFTNIRSSGRYITVLDFSKLCDNPEIYNHQLYTVNIIGDLVSATPVKWSEEGLPPPPNDYSEYVLKLVISGNGTVRIVVPARARPFKPFVCYFCVYSPTGNVLVNNYITLGSDPNQVRNKLTLAPVPAAGKWARFVNHWFTEFHHGLANYVIEITNQSSGNETVYIGMISVGELERFTKGYMLLFGWEDNFTIGVFNNTEFFNIDLMVPMDDKPCLHMWVNFGCHGVGDVNVYLVPRDVKIASMSINSTTTYYSGRYFKLLLNARGVINYNTFRIQMVASSAFRLYIDQFVIVIYGFSEPYTYTRYVTTTVAAGQSALLYDALHDFSMIKRAKIWIPTTTSGTVSINGKYKTITDTLIQLPSNFSNTPTNPIEIEGLYDNIEIVNQGSSEITVHAQLELIDAITPY